MSFMVVVAIQHRIVNQLHLIFLNSITLFLLLFCNLSLAKGWRVWPLDLVHKIMHKFLTKAIQWTSSHHLHFLLNFIAIYSIQRIIYRLLYKFYLFVEFHLLLWFVWRIHRVRLTLDVLFYLIFLLDFRNLYFSSRKIFFEKFALCESWKFLAQLYILDLIIMITLTSKSLLCHIELWNSISFFSISWELWRSLYLSMRWANLTNIQMRLVSQLLFCFVISPRIDFKIRFGFNFNNLFIRSSFLKTHSILLFFTSNQISISIW